MKFGVFLLLFTLFFFKSALIHAEGRQLMIGRVPAAPFAFIDEQGKIVGIDIDIVDHILGRMGVPYNVRLYKSAARLEHTWKETTELDMLLTYSYKSWKEKFLIYSKQSHIRTQFNFFILRENEGRINYNSLDDLKGLYVGVTTGFTYTPEFWKAIDSGIFHAEALPQNHLQMKKLLAGRIDAVPLATSVELYQASIGGYRDKITYLPKPLKSRLYYNTFARSSTFPHLDKIIKRYDEELIKMKTDGTLQTIFLKYGLELSCLKGGVVDCFLNKKLVKLLDN